MRSGELPHCIEIGRRHGNGDDSLDAMSRRCIERFLKRFLIQVIQMAMGFYDRRRKTGDRFVGCWVHVDATTWSRALSHICVAGVPRESN